MRVRRIVVAAMVAVGLAVGPALPAHAAERQQASAKWGVAIIVKHTASSDVNEFLVKSDGVTNRVKRGTTREVMAHGSPRYVYVNPGCTLIWNPWGIGRWEWYGYGGRWIRVNWTYGATVKLEC